MFSGLLFSGNLIEKSSDITYTDSVTNVVNNQVKESLSKMGVLWIPDNGLILGFYFITNTLDREFNDTKSEFMTKIGYVF